MKRALALVFVAAIGLTLSTPAQSGKKKKDPAPAPAPAAEQHEHAEAAAEDGPFAGVVSYRHNLLEGVAKHFKLTKMIVTGKVDRPGDLAGHAHAIQAAFADFGTLFPAGSGHDAYPKSEALPTIWSDADGFAAAIERVQTESAERVRLADAGDVEGVQAQFGKVGAACGGCHDSYREDD